MMLHVKKILRNCAGTNKFSRNVMLCFVSSRLHFFHAICGTFFCQKCFETSVANLFQSEIHNRSVSATISLNGLRNMILQNRLNIFSTTSGFQW